MMRLCAHNRGPQHVVNAYLHGWNAWKSERS